MQSAGAGWHPVVPGPAHKVRPVGSHGSTAAVGTFAFATAILKRLDFILKTPLI
jgi:hypothetical protein